MYRHYVNAGSRVVAVVEREDTGSPSNTKKFLHRDNQGSVTKVTNSSGSVIQALAFDAWGLRRDATDWSDLGSPFGGSHETERGYTGHEHLDNVGLVHMNGRVQDPLLGRFISADPFVPNPLNPQSHNRYSYVRNNPASLIDPSGFTEEEHEVVRVVGQCDAHCQWYREFLNDGRRQDYESFWEWLARIGLLPEGGSFGGSTGGNRNFMGQDDSGGDEDIPTTQIEVEIDDRLAGAVGNEIQRLNLLDPAQFFEEFKEYGLQPGLDMVIEAVQQDVTNKLRPYAIQGIINSHTPGVTAQVLTSLSIAGNRSPRIGLLSRILDVIGIYDAASAVSTEYDFEYSCRGGRDCDLTGIHRQE